MARYQPVRRIAVGGMAEIQLARVSGEGGFEKLVVLKRLLPQHAGDADLVRMMLDEARLMATLQHPNVAQVYDVGVDPDDGQHFFAMEYVHGEDLRAILRAAEGPLPMAIAAGIVSAAASGLHHAHDKRNAAGQPLGIVHRDVSPSNVLVGYDGIVKVTDFGVAKWAAQSAETRHGTLKGKMGYMSPEQARAEPLDRRSDVFALGILLYEATTGRKAFAGESDFDVLSRIVAGRLTPPREISPGFPPALEAILHKAMAVDPARRYDTARAFEDALLEFARESDLGDLGPRALARFMEDTFAGKVAAWRAAERSGATLADHLSITMPAPNWEATATDHAPPDATGAPVGRPAANDAHAAPDTATAPAAPRPDRALAARVPSIATPLPDRRTRPLMAMLALAGIAAVALGWAWAAGTLATRRAAPIPTTQRGVPGRGHTPGGDPATPQSPAPVASPIAVSAPAVTAGAVPAPAPSPRPSPSALDPDGGSDFRAPRGVRRTPPRTLAPNGPLPAAGNAPATSHGPAPTPTTDAPAPTPSPTIIWDQDSPKLPR